MQRDYTRPIIYGMMFGAMPEGIADLALMSGHVSAFRAKCIKQTVAIALLAAIYQNLGQLVRVVGITQCSYLFSYVLKTHGMPEREANILGSLLRMIARYGLDLTHVEGLTMILLGGISGHLAYRFEKCVMRQLSEAVRRHF